MSKIVRFAFLLAAVAALPWTASAQRGGAAGGPAPVAAPAPAPSGGRDAAHPSSTGTVSVRPHHSSPIGVHGTSAHHSTGNNTETNATPQAATPNVVVVPADSNLSLQDLTGQVPGLGFDFEHLAAISGNLAEKALTDPVTMEELALAQRFNRNNGGSSAFFLGGGYGGGDYSAAPVDNGDSQDPAAQPAAQPAPQIIIVQQPASASQQNGGANARAQEQAGPPLPEASDFLLVLKSGAMVSAVAFTRQGDQLVYVTKEGNRRTMSVATIDSDATSKLNAARGTPLKLSI
jgi:hypothetical protein